MTLTINGSPFDIPSAWSDDTLLSVLREVAGLSGAKFGCGVGLCGACTVIIDGESVRSCQLRAADVVGRKVRTIEGLADGETLHPVQAAWLAESVAQCGYCQAGQIMAAVALLERTPDPSDAEIDDAMSGNLCRCGTYPRIRKAIRRSIVGPR